MQWFQINKTSKFNKITKKFLKICEKSLIMVLISFFQICVTKKYHFQFYWNVNTVVLRKSKKTNYIIMKTWRPIALLNTIEKMLKTVISHKLFHLVKHDNWLFASQMKTRLNRLIKIALKFLIKQIHTIWNTKNDKIVMLLNMNVVHVFLMINHEQLLHNFWKKKYLNE